MKMQSRPLGGAAARWMRPCTGVLAAALLGAASSAALAQTVIRGAGATFPAQIYEQWGQTYQREKGPSLQYQATGSGDGVKQALARSADFGATDSPMSASELEQAHLIQFPTVVGAIAPSVNLPGIGPGQLRLDGATLGALFAGDITQWNDARLARLNPQLYLPALPVVRVVRADSSGSTETFTRYLAAVSPQWKGRSGKTVDWAGKVTAAKGTSGVVQALQAQSGAIAYVAYDRVEKQGLNPVTLQNAAGTFVRPSVDSMRAAVRHAGLADNLHASVLNAPGAASWPLTELTYILMPANPANASQVAPTLSFFTWALLRGDATVRNTGFVALPANVQAAAFKSMMAVRPADGSFVSLQR